MAGRKVRAYIDRFAGLSDRDDPLQLTRIESPDLRNVEFCNRVMARRNGYRRVHASMLRDSSALFDGIDDYVRIPDQTAFDFASRGYVGLGVVLRSFPSAEVTVAGRGTGAGSSRFFQLSYDPSVNSNKGGWRLRVYDSGVGLRNVTINDGSGPGAGTTVDNYRFIEVCYSGTSDTYNFKVLDSSGSTVGSTTLTVAGWISSADDWFLGADSATAGFAHATLCEFRLYNASSAPSFQGAYGRELTGSEAASCVSYHKLNDGNGSTVSDSSDSGINGFIGGEGPEWVSDSSVVTGRSGLEFYGEEGFVHIHANGAASSGTFNAVANSAGGTTRNWALTLCFTPRMAAGETTVRDQTLIWAGTDASNPAPFGIRVVSNDLRGYYQDGTSTKTIDLGLTLSDHANKRIRLFLIVQPEAISSGSATSEILSFGYNSELSSSSWGYKVPAVSTDNQNPSSVNDNWSVGRKMTDFSFPPTTSAGDTCFGVVSDIALFKGLGVSPMGFNLLTTPFKPWGRRPTPGPTIASSTARLEIGIPLDDASGQTPETVGTLTSTSAALYPEEESGIRWDIGLVDPYQAPEAQALFGFDRIGPTGSPIRELMAISGTTLYSIDTSAGTANPVAGNLHKGGKWSVAQYGQSVYLACANGKRPRVWDGNLLDWVGIRAPFQTPKVTSKTSGGSLADATYYVKVTYRNSVNGSESDPSPAGSASISGGSGSGAIDRVRIPTSSDPQVTERRVWLSNDNATFYLAATIYDNETDDYTTDITTLDLNATTVSSVGSEEAPTGSVVEVFKDRLFVSGHPVYPTRIYWSSPGVLSAFNQTTGFVDVDLDSGDPVVALETLRDGLVAHLRDGRVQVTASGDSTDPFFLAFMSRDSGAVGPLCVLEIDSAQFYVGERDIVFWDGVNTFNASSPRDAERPSIQRFVRETIDSSRRRDISVALHRDKSQAWITLSTSGATRNNAVLVFDYSQGVWSRYQMDMDVLAEIEDENDDPTLYGVSWGHVVKLDTGDFDGHDQPAATAAGTASGGTTTSLTDSDHGGTWTTDYYKGMYAVWYDFSAGTLQHALISGNDANTLTFYETQSNAPASGDIYGIGAYEFWAEFNLNFGDAMRLVKLQWVQIRGTSDSSSNRVRIAMEPDVLSAAMPFSGDLNSEDAWATTETYKLLPAGGIGRNWRVRIGDAGYASQTGAAFPPSIFGKLSISEISFEGVEVSAR